MFVLERRIASNRETNVLEDDVADMMVVLLWLTVP
jgi:hypothetical protein